LAGNRYARARLTVQFACIAKNILDAASADADELAQRGFHRTGARGYVEVIGGVADVLRNVLQPLFERVSQIEGAVA
jgi:hypothetical protein